MLEPTVLALMYSDRTSVMARIAGCVPAVAASGVVGKVLGMVTSSQRRFLDRRLGSW